MNCSFLLQECRPAESASVSLHSHVVSITYIRWRYSSRSLPTTSPKLGVNALTDSYASYSDRLLSFTSHVMEQFDRCVEGKADGLREGDECIDEAEAYKKCRQLVREAKLKLRDADKQKPR